MEDNQYKCAMCGNIYEKDCSEEEMMQECIDNFGIMAAYEKLNIVCNDCYQKINPHLYTKIKYN